MSSSSSSSRHHHHHHRQTYEEKDLETNGQMIMGENILHVKFLLPGTTTGSVIGKGGERIASLQKETNTKMKMSKAGDYFPGTQERVCLVVGTVPNVTIVYEFIADKIKESFPGDVLRSRQVKLVIPNATAGVIIGKGGSTIETIKQDTGASLTITPKCDMAERVMTIIGEDPNRIKALEVVLHKILQDPHHDSVPGVNYSNGATSSSGGGGGGYPQQTTPNDLESFSGPGGINAKMNALMSVPQSSNGSTSNNSLSNMSMQLSGLHRLAQLIIGAGGTNHMTVDSLTHSLTSLGFPDPHTTEIVQAIGALINYGLIIIQTPLSVSSPSISGNNLFASAPLLSSPPQPHHPHNHYSHHHHSMFAPPTNYTLTSSQRDRQDGYSTSGGSSSDMDYKRFKSDQQRSNKTKR